MQIKEASGFILWFMQWCRFGGWTSLWDTIYIQPQFQMLDSGDVLPGSTFALLWE